MNNEGKEELISFLEARSFCVISTVTADAKPEAAFVGFTSSSNLEVVVGTSIKSRKYQNMLHNKSIALVVADLTGEVQYEGEVEIITPETYDELLAAGRFKKLGGYDKYRNDPVQTYLRIRPTWIRFIVHGENDQIAEFTEFA